MPYPYGIHDIRYRCLPYGQSPRVRRGFVENIYDDLLKEGQRSAGQNSKINKADSYQEGPVSNGMQTCFSGEIKITDHTQSR